LEPAGPYAEFSPRVTCAVDFYGAVKLLDYHDMKMFSKTRAESPELYEKASPVNYVGRGDAPILVAHGTADKTVPISQSEALVAAYKKAGAECVFVVLPGAPHTFDLDWGPDRLRPAVLGFLDKHLRAEGPLVRAGAGQ
jgi:dipeptidyl aminopeptidase/acylaminoacyl peptidase